MEAQRETQKDTHSKKWLVYAAAAGIIILVFGIVFAGVLLFYLNTRIVVPLSHTQCEKSTIVIDEGEGAKEIGRKLEHTHLIKNDFLFLYYVTVERISSKLQAGTYEFTPCMSIRDIAEAIENGNVIKDMRVTIPEGFTLKQIEDLLRDSDLPNNLSSISAGGMSNDFPVLEDVPTDSTLEGYLFPDTYFFEEDSDEQDIILTMLENFTRKFTADFEIEIKNQGRTIHEVITMASLIEKEVSRAEDRKLVSGILWKRLLVGMPLQVDATIVYLLNRKTSELTYDDIRTDSSYNTYLHRGLPPGPISNPGIESIAAAIYPVQSEYWYYLSKPTGETVFSRTLEDHNRAKAQYLK